MYFNICSHKQSVCQRPTIYKQIKVFRNKQQHTYTYKQHTKHIDVPFFLFYLDILEFV